MPDHLTPVPPVPALPVRTRRTVAKLPRLALRFDVNTLLQLGYVAHVVNEEDIHLAKLREAGLPATGYKPNVRIARKQMEDFLGVKVEPDTPDYDYLFKVRGVVLGLGKSITRRKDLYMKENAAAWDFRKNELERYNMARSDVFWKTVAQRAFLSGGLGFFLMQTLLPFIQVKAHNPAAIEDAGVKLSLLIALIFMAITKVATQKMDDNKLTSIYTQHEWMVHQAQLNYAKGKLSEYKVAESDLRRLWKEYTGLSAPNSLNYHAVLEEDIAMLEEWMAERQQYTMSVVARLGCTCKGMIERWRARRDAARKQNVARRHKSSNLAEPAANSVPGLTLKPGMAAATAPASAAKPAE